MSMVTAMDIFQVLFPCSSLQNYYCHSIPCRRTTFMNCPGNFLNKKFFKKTIYLKEKSSQFVKELTIINKDGIKIYSPSLFLRRFTLLQSDTVNSSICGLVKIVILKILSKFELTHSHLSAL